MEGLTERTYEHRVHLLEGGIERFRNRPGLEGAISRYAEGIGNVYQEFDPPRADEWYARSLEWLAKLSTDPSIRRAFILWKMGREERFEAETREVLRFQRERLKSSWTESASPATLAAARVELLIALFLLGEYESAKEYGASLVESGKDSNAPTVIKAIGEMSESLLSTNSFGAGIEVLKESVKEWPTSDSGLDVDLYRYAIKLEAELGAR